ncbi:hypothetical protein [Sulfitobacter sp. CW3]|uniref:hypothetical protein n=1 Tax=Sulfitobacter sp. CW3 TaxID=2861965 RepID=UPI001C5D5D49|nr:hypothetical protein [Sulfitobacter sp. CW3]MBW4963834.1 hypothetical protein [Sulfitobacter sp. CW3]
MSDSNPISIYNVGMSVGILLALSFALCVVFGLIFAGATMYQVWLPLLPGVSWISWQSALLGLVESYAYGWYIAMIFVPAWNFFSRRASA